METLIKVRFSTGILITIILVLIIIFVGSTICYYHYRCTLQIFNCFAAVGALASAISIIIIGIQSYSSIKHIETTVKEKYLPYVTRTYDLIKKCKEDVEKIKNNEDIGGSLCFFICIGNEVKINPRVLKKEEYPGFFGLLILLGYDKLLKELKDIAEFICKGEVEKAKESIRKKKILNKIEDLIKKIKEEYPIIEFYETITVA